MSIILVISRPRQDNATSETLVSPNRIPIAMQLPVEKLLRGLKTRARTHVAMDHALLADADTKRCRLISISPIPGSPDPRRCKFEGKEFSFSDIYCPSHHRPDSPHDHLISPTSNHEATKGNSTLTERGSKRGPGSSGTFNECVCEIRRINQFRLNNPSPFLARLPIGSEL
jgi:hypothetical protein